MTMTTWRYKVTFYLEPAVEVVLMGDTEPSDDDILAEAVDVCPFHAAQIERLEEDPGNACSPEKSEAE